MPGYLGSGQTNGRIIYVPIPKNASSAHNGMFKTEGRTWSRTFFHSEVALQPAYVPVRHPVDRWYSGINTYERRGKGKGLEDIVKEVLEGHSPVYDEHTFKQSDFILSSLREVILVRLESATQWCLDNLGLDLPHVRGRQSKPDYPQVNPILEAFYVEDLALYESALVY